VIGKTLAHYEITGLLGKGGMGVVYSATDTKLRRDVAIKVLPDDFAQDQERLPRFEREAHILASLNHTGIASIYGLEESGGIRFLVMELVPGETLADRLAKGPLPVDEALRVARQIAEALEEAHEHAIIHRDLKPGNIMVTADGKVRVLDFGLAKALSIDGSEQNLSQSRTAALDMTHSGVILGTASYMSPEQARGKPVDKRTDIFAFGSVIYEMLAGQRAFGGDTVSDTIAAILAREPELERLPPATPTKVSDLLRRCLKKDPHQRLHDIADARIEIDDALAGGADTAVPPVVASTGRGSRWLPWIIAATAVAVAWAVSPLDDEERALSAAAIVVGILVRSYFDPGQIGRILARQPVGRVLAQWKVVSYERDRRRGCRDLRS
jgi:serine/threonine protein kinase